MNNILKYDILDSGKIIVTVSTLLTIITVIIFTVIILFIVRKFFLKRVRQNGEHSARLISVFNLIRYFIWIIVIAECLDLAGIRITFLLAGSAALLVGLGLGLQQTFNDFVSGIIILAEGTIKVDDIVEVQGIVGRVMEISLRTTKIYSRDAIYIIVPNHKFINEDVINWTRDQIITRFRIVVGVGYESDELQVKDILYDCAVKHPKIIPDNELYPVLVRISNFGESTIDFELLFWSDEIFYIENIKSDLRYEIRKRFREEGISLPFPQRDIHIIKQDLNIRTQDNIKS